MAKQPTTLGGLADAIYKKRSTRIDLQQKVDALKAEERTLGDEALKLLHRNKLMSGRGKLATLTKVIKTVPVVDDWAAVYAYIAKHDAFDLLQRRIASQAWNDRALNNETVPGVSADRVVSLSVTRASSKRGA
jgi:hypothetical protein